MHTHIDKHNLPTAAGLIFTHTYIHTYMHANMRRHSNNLHTSARLSHTHNYIHTYVDKTYTIEPGSFISINTYINT
jgi:hypothetical protein